MTVNNFIRFFILTIVILIIPHDANSNSNKLNEIVKKLESTDVKIKRSGLYDYEYNLDRKVALSSIEFLIPLLKNYSVKWRCVDTIGKLFIPSPNNPGMYVTQTFDIKRLEIDELYISATNKIIPHLVTMLTDKDEYIREVTAEALCYMGPPAKSAIPELISLLEDEKGRVRYEALRAIVNIDPCGKEIPIAVEKMINDENSNVKQLANDALHYLEKKNCK